MKAIKILSCAVLALAMVSCDNFDLPNPPGQINAEPTGVFTDADFAISEVTGTLNLPEANQANRFVTVGVISKMNNFPESYALNVDMEVAADDSFSKSATIGTVIDGNKITVNPDLLNGAIQEVKTRKPGTYDMAARFVAYAVKGNTKLRLGGLDATYGKETLSVKTLDAAKVIEDAYYLVPCDENGQPEMSKAVQMLNTAGEGVSPYDNPQFAIKFEVPVGEEYRFRIAPQSAMVSGNTAALYGGLAADNISGKLGTGYAAGVITLSGDVLLTVDMELDSYTVNYAFEVLYPFSGSVKVENMMLLYTSNYINYSGVAAINQLVTFAAQPDKNGPVVFKADASVEPEISENGLHQTGALTAETGAQVRGPIKGNCLYWVDLNLVQLTYELSALQTLSVIGSGNDWKLETATPLTPSKDLRTWTATDVVIGDMFKINANGAWDYDFGGSASVDAMGGYEGTLNYKGSNIEVAAGTYDVTVDFSVSPYVVKLVKK